ncbi:hypothetical protein B1813_22775 [Saccharomonospora piscinae]|uniref:Pycsar effector protein domain-containing protein n=1 Tax=Saccharomonospora piscinae TaxID=687388 RepID=A0A1V8ZVY2_SACPI|nr:Pycsar system effector family protein [Saccharomonospora piscinae]OQO88980.1 hypothetical protein B1813_22775 [Saccharomonospora piscinae]
MTTASTAPHTVDLPPRLVEARALVYTELQRADAKASGLLTIAPLAVAAAALAVDTDDVDLPAVSIVGLWAAGLLLAGAVVLLLDVIRPRLGRQSQPGTWLHAARHGADTLLDSASTAEVIAEDVAALARSAVRKHHRLRVAVWLVIAAVVALAASLAVAAAH